MGKVNFFKKTKYAKSELFLDKVSERTATTNGLGTGAAFSSDEIIEAVGVTGQTAYKILLPNPRSVASNKRFLIIGKDFPSKLAVNGAAGDATINGIEAESATGTIAVGGCYEVRKISDTGYIVTGMVIA